MFFSNRTRQLHPACELQDALRKLNELNRSALSLQSANLALTRKRLAQAKQIVELSRRSIGSVTGGDSFYSPSSRVLAIQIHLCHTFLTSKGIPFMKFMCESLTTVSWLIS